MLQTVLNPFRSTFVCWSSQLNDRRWGGSVGLSVLTRRQSMQMFCLVKGQALAQPMRRVAELAGFVADNISRSSTIEGSEAVMTTNGV
jgi:hypothetical protein